IQEVSKVVTTDSRQDGMMELRGQGRPITELLELSERSAPKRATTHAHITAALAGRNRAAKNVFTIVRLFQPGPLTRTALEYDGAVLIKESIPSAEFLDALRVTERSKHLTLPRVTVALRENGNYEMKGSGNAYTGSVPCFLIELYSSEPQQ